MAQQSEYISSETLRLFQNFQNTMLSYTEIGQLLDRKPSVIAQYAKADLIHPIQQGCRKLVYLKEVYLLEVYMHAVEHYGCSYTACKIIGGLLQNTDIAPELYKDYLLNIEGTMKITKDEVSKYVNSYKHRGIFQKQKTEESRENIYRCTEYSAQD